MFAVLARSYEFMASEQVVEVKCAVRLTKLISHVVLHRVVTTVNNIVVGLAIKFTNWSG